MTVLTKGGCHAVDAMRQMGMVALVATALAGCSKLTPEARPESVGEGLSASTAELASNVRIENTEDLLPDLHDRIRTLEQRLGARAAGVAISRLVESALLEVATLKQSAIGLSVEDCCVTLAGVVHSEVDVGRALGVAGSRTGVEAVSAKTRVNAPAANEASGS